MKNRKIRVNLLYKKYGVILIFIIFIILDLLFNLELTKEIFINSPTRSFEGDTISYQYFSESFYQNLIHLKNPFSYNDQLLYPFGSSTALQDLGFIHALYFVFLRPFFSVHVALIISVLISVFLNEAFTYLLLRYFHVSKFVSFVFALVFAFSPFMVGRIHAHYSYVHFFVFPLTLWLFLNILKRVKRFELVIYSILLGFSLGLMLYSTLYYFVMFVLLVIFYILFYITIFRSKVWQIVKLVQQKFRYFLLSSLIFLLFISPLLIEGYDLFKTGDYVSTKGWEGAIGYSVKLLSIFLPSQYNPFFGKEISSKFQDLQPFEGLIYPGILVLLGVGLYIKIRAEKGLLPLLFTGAFFYILALGPFLLISLPPQIAFYRSLLMGNSDSFIFVIPLPYILLHEIPFVSAIRSPVRFVTPFVFCMVIIAAVTVDKYLTKRRKRLFFYTLLLLIFFIDQSYTLYLQGTDLNLPYKSYQYIKNDPNLSTVFEIPFVIRDGTNYWGNVESTHFEMGQLQHGKPVIGGYFGRVNDYKFGYYEGNPLIGYYGSLIDTRRDLKLLKPSSADIETALDFLDIKYVLVKNDLPAANEIKEEMMGDGYNVVFDNDNNFTFLKRELTKKEYRNINLSQLDSGIFIFGSWSEPVNSFRWIIGSRGGVLFKLNQASVKSLYVTAFSPRGKKVKLLLNRKFQGKFYVEGLPKTYKINLDNSISGINRLDFILEGESNLPLSNNFNSSTSFAISQVAVADD